MSDIQEFNLTPGTMTRAVEDWCETCMKSTLKAGSITNLTNEDATLWGHVKGCVFCHEWVYTRLDGKIF